MSPYFSPSKLKESLPISSSHTTRRHVPHDANCRSCHPEKLEQQNNTRTELIPTTGRLVVRCIVRVKLRSCCVTFRAVFVSRAS